MAELSHLNDRGEAVMVDVSEKAVTARSATAKGCIKMKRQVLEIITQGTASKGDVLGVARVAGIMACKKTSELIPLCHPLAITKATVDFQIVWEQCAIECTCTVKTDGKTGVEMEALTGVSVALLTLYDMCKAADKSMLIGNTCLLHKSGGKSGEYSREDA